MWNALSWAGHWDEFGPNNCPNLSRIWNVCCVVSTHAANAHIVACLETLADDQRSARQTDAPAEEQFFQRCPRQCRAGSIGSPPSWIASHRLSFPVLYKIFQATGNTFQAIGTCNTFGADEITECLPEQKSADAQCMRMLGIVLMNAKVHAQVYAGTDHT